MVRSGDAQILNTSNVRVIVRVRPPSVPEQSGCVACLSDSTLKNDSSPQFTFDKVHGLPYGASNTQTDIFSDVQDIVLSTLEGLNGCIMAYGQAGTGKRYTLAGTGELENSTKKGLLTRSLEHLAQQISRTTDGSHFKVYMSAVGVSRDSIHSLAEPVISLLSVTSHVNDDISLLAAQQCNTYGNGIAELIQAKDINELVDLAQQNLARERVAYTHMKAASDRSDVFNTLTVERHLPSGNVTCGKLTLIKLAGYEDQDKMSALALLLAFEEQKARMALIICCSPAASDAAETVSSLRFAAHAKRIMTGVQVPTALTALKSASDVGLEILSIEASAKLFIRKVGQLTERTSMQAPDVGKSAVTLMTQMTAVLDSIVELNTQARRQSTAWNDLRRIMLDAAKADDRKAAMMREESARLLEEAQKEREEAAKVREESTRLVEKARKDREKTKKAREESARLLEEGQEEREENRKAHEESIKMLAEADAGLRAPAKARVTVSWAVWKRILLEAAGSLLITLAMYLVTRGWLPAGQGQQPARIEGLEAQP